jgi:oligoribonuclease
MRYISIDIETTGIDPDFSQILSIGAIIEDTEKKLPFKELPKFHAAISRKNINGEAFAINMNRDLISKIVEYNEAETPEDKTEVEEKYNLKFFPEEEIVQEFYWWLIANNITESKIEDPKSLNGILNNFVHNHPVYGMVPVLNRSNPLKAVITAAGKNFSTFDKLFLEKLPRWKQVIKIRSRVIDPGILFVDWKNDDAPPGLSTCKERAGLDKNVSHDALEDAWDVINLLRKTY